MNIKDFILGYVIGKNDAGGGGGGGDVDVDSLTVTENGTYTAEEGTAYSPVVVNVPNSYTQSDEGKVVSNGALVAQSSDTVTQNGTVDTTLINSLLVNVAGGSGGLEYEEGTWTPATETADYTIPLNNTHDKAPFFYMISDATGTYDETAGNLYGVTFFNFGAIWSAVDVSESAKQYGRIIYAYRMNSTTVTSATQTLTDFFTSGTSTAATNARYWATETFIRARGDGSRKFKTNRTYKWIAVWAPES